jgi:hypothetical protein
VTDVPLGRYFAVVGPALLALLILAPWYFPNGTTSRENGAPSVHGSAIRINSDQKWPERVVMDTTLPTIVPAQPNVVAASTPIAPASKVRDFAEMKPLPASPTRQHAATRPKHRIVRQSPPAFGYPTHMAANPSTIWPPSW